MATLRFEVKGQMGSLTLRGFLVAVENSFRMLSEYDAAISGERRGSLDWVVTDVHSGSVVLETESRSRLGDKNFGFDVARSFVKGWQLIEHDAVSPPYLTEAGMARALKIVRLIGREGTLGFIVSDSNEIAEISPQASVNLNELLKVHHRSIGSVEGQIETISIHGKPRFIVYHARTKKAITCRVDAEKLKQMVQTDMMGSRVRVAGIVYSNVKGEPIRVDAERIRLLHRDSELPSIQSLGGSDPDFTGDLSTEEFIRSIRSG